MFLLLFKTDSIKKIQIFTIETPKPQNPFEMKNLIMDKLKYNNLSKIICCLNKICKGFIRFKSSRDISIIISELINWNNSIWLLLIPKTQRLQVYIFLIFTVLIYVWMLTHIQHFCDVIKFH